MILITGGSGFLGEALISRLYPEPIRVVSRNEGKLVELKEKFPEIEILTGNIADDWVAKKAMNGARAVYHLAAYKHVALAEENILECINSNIVGSINLLKESIETKPLLMVGISTDKAAQVKGIYGATKLCMEGLFQEVEKINPQTKYRVVRYGNVLYSTGSVLCKWKSLIEQGKPVTLTNPESTRFYWTREQAVDHIFECIDKARDSKPYVPTMKAASLGDLLTAMMNKYGEVEVKKSSLGSADNLHETMDGRVFSNEVDRLSIKELERLI